MALMKPTKQPSEIAREALRLLSARKLSPTPGNYRECYYEIANQPNLIDFPEERLRNIAFVLRAYSAEQQADLDKIDLAIRKHSWQGIEDALKAYVKHAVSPAPHDVGIDARSIEQDESKHARKCFSRIASIIHSMHPALVDDDEGFADQMAAIAHTLRDPAVDVEVVRQDLDLFSRRLPFAAEEQREIKQTLLKLLHVIIENFSKLLVEDSWLDGQIATLLDAVSPPLSLRRLDDAERRLRDVMHKQAAAKERSIEAQAEIRQMLGTFIERLTTMNASSSQFHRKLEASAWQIEQARSFADITPLLHDVIAAARGMAEETARSREELTGLQQKVLATEAEIAKLHLELNNASAMARHDPLTNTLNRKGLDEVMTREMAAMQRKGTPLSLALLDIDNFKRLNDRLGHTAGDAALVHLVSVVRQCMRPSDSVARYGGEEFVILMPDTPLEEAVIAMTRLQRELTRNFFLSNNEKVLITFSAGAVQLAEDDTRDQALNRADAAMYLAKRSGKNRVLVG